MKAISVLVFLIIFPFMATKAQKALIVRQDSIKFGQNKFPSISVIIPEAGYEKTLKAWKKELQSGTKSKLVTENGEMSIFGARIKEISPNSLNVYSRLVNLDSMLKLNVAFELKKDQYLEKATNDTAVIKAGVWLKEFARHRYADLVKNQTDTAEKKLADLQKELALLEEDKTRLKKLIQSGYNNITTEDANINVKKNELTILSAELDEQRKVLNAMDNDPARKEKADYIKDLEKRHKKTRKSIESSEEKIAKLNNEIEMSNLEIPKNETLQQEVKEKINSQEAVCRKYAEKLTNIKSL